MPDLKISQLPVATTPLAGTELVPIVQGGVTDQTTVQAIMTSTVPSGTANGVLYLNGSKVATSGSALVFDGSNLGLGVTPSASVKPALMIGNRANLWQQTAANVNLGYNVYESAANTLTYRISDFASMYGQVNGVHLWYTAPSGTAGNAISFTQAMTLDASGNLQVGTSNGTFINGKGIVIADATAARLKLADTDAGVGTSNGLELGFGGAIGSIYNLENGALLFGTNNTERARITSTGNVVAGGSVALATTATDGFLYVPTCAGTPTGTPTAITGMAPIVVDTTNNKMYFYSGGAWRDAGP